jgi:DNA-binding MarR family transcriptional regulator
VVIVDEATPLPITPLLRTLDHSIDEALRETLERHRLSRTQWHALNVLAEGPSTFEKLEEAISEPLDSDSNASVGDVFAAEMELLLSGGLVVEKAGVYHLGNAGRAEYRATREAMDGIRDRMLQGLDDGDYARAVQTLEKMIDNLSR